MRISLQSLSLLFLKLPTRVYPSNVPTSANGGMPCPLHIVVACKSPFVTYFTLAPMRTLVAWIALGLVPVSALAQGDYPFIQTASFRLTFPIGWQVAHEPSRAMIKGPRGEQFALRSASTEDGLTAERQTEEVKRMEDAFLDASRKFFLENRAMADFHTEKVQRPDGSTKLTLTTGAAPAPVAGLALVTFVVAGPRTVIWMRGAVPAPTVKDSLDTMRQSIHVLVWAHER